MKNQAVQTIETGAIKINKNIFQKKKNKLQRSSLTDEPLPYLKPFKQNNQINLKQLFIPNLKKQESHQKSKQNERYLSIQPNLQQISNYVIKLRRYSHLDFIPRTDRILSVQPTQSLATSRPLSFKFDIISKL